MLKKGLDPKKEIPDEVKRILRDVGLEDKAKKMS